MFLYLVQHAQAKSKEDDPHRALTKKGLQDITKVAEYISKLNIPLDKIIHSGKLRARQTAEKIAEKLIPEGNVEEQKGLAPLDDPSAWVEKIKNTNENIIVTGHLPFLEKFTSLLLCGDPNKRIVSFQMGGIIALKREEEIWSLDWIITPDIVF